MQHTQRDVPELARVKVLKGVDPRQRAAHHVAHVVEAAVVAPEAALHEARDEVARVLQLV